MPAAHSLFVDAVDCSAAKPKLEAVGPPGSFAWDTTAVTATFKYTAQSGQAALSATLDGAPAGCTITPGVLLGGHWPCTLPTSCFAVSDHAMLERGQMRARSPNLLAASCRHVMLHAGSSLSGAQAGTTITVSCPIAAGNPGSIASVHTVALTAAFSSIADGACPAGSVLALASLTVEAKPIPAPTVELSAPAASGLAPVCKAAPGKETTVVVSFPYTVESTLGVPQLVAEGSSSSAAATCTPSLTGEALCCAQAPCIQPNNSPCRVTAA